jgi:CheY-like chemotaxis protein
MAEVLKPILVVDDDSSFLRMLQDVLEDEGYQVETLSESAQCVHLVKQLQPALVILDLFLEDLPGLKVLELIKADPETATIPVLLCSASTADLERVEPQLLRQGVERLSKPFELEDLIEKVHCLTGDASAVALAAVIP